MLFDVAKKIVIRPVLRLSLLWYQFTFHKNFFCNHKHTYCAIEISYILNTNKKYSKIIIWKSLASVLVSIHALYIFTNNGMVKKPSICLIFFDFLFVNVCSRYSFNGDTKKNERKKRNPSVVWVLNKTKQCEWMTDCLFVDYVWGFIILHMQLLRIYKMNKYTSYAYLYCTLQRLACVFCARDESRIKSQWKLFRFLSENQIITWMICVFYHTHTLTLLSLHTHTHTVFLSFFLYVICITRMVECDAHQHTHTPFIVTSHSVCTVNRSRELSKNTQKKRATKVKDSCKKDGVHTIFKSMHMGYMRAHIGNKFAILMCSYYAVINILRWHLFVIDLKHVQQKQKQQQQM